MLIRSVCEVIRVARLAIAMKPRTALENGLIANCLSCFADNIHSWGFVLCELRMSNIKNFKWNCKRIYLVCRKLELNLCIKSHKRLVRDKPDALLVSAIITQVWSINFMHDQLEDGRSIRLFNVIDYFNRDASGIDAYLSLPAERVVRKLDQIIAWRVSLT